MAIKLPLRGNLEEPPSWHNISSRCSCPSYSLGGAIMVSLRKHPPDQWLTSDLAQGTHQLGEAGSYS